MSEFIWYVIGLATGVGWGMWLQEKLEIRRIAKRVESRIVVDAPFTPVQAQIIMRTLAELVDFTKESEVK